MISYISQYVTAFLSRNMLVTLTVLTVIAIRFSIRKLPKRYSYALWSLVGIRMLFDMEIPSPLSILNLFRSVDFRQNAGDTGQIRQLKESASLALHSETLSQNVLSRNVLSENMNAISQNALSQNVISQSVISQGSIFAENGGQPLTGSAAGYAPHLSANEWISLIWVLGFVILLIYAVYSYVCVRKKVVFSTPMKEEKDVYESDRIHTAFVMGIIAPKIYVPYGLGERELAYILCHERYHIRRKDTWFKALAFLLLCLYWCNPLIWLAFWLFCLDMEMSCDEAVLSRLGSNIKKEYSLSLLSLASGRNYWRAVPLGFGESDAGKRIRHVLGFRKPKEWMHLAAVAVILIMIPVCLTKADSSVKEAGIDGTTGIYDEKGEAENSSALLHRNVNANLRQVGPAGNVAATSQGLYFTEQWIDNEIDSGCRLLYFDSSTEKIYAVCPDQSCTHDTAACDAIYALVGKGDMHQMKIFPLGVYENKLYILGSVLEGSLLRLYRSDLNGENRELLWQEAYESSNPDVADRMIIAGSVLWNDSQVFMEYCAEDHVHIERNMLNEETGTEENVSKDVVAHEENGILCIDVKDGQEPVRICEEGSRFDIVKSENDGQEVLDTVNTGYVSMMAVRDGAVYYRHLRSDDVSDRDKSSLNAGSADTEQGKTQFTGRIMAATVQGGEVSEKKIIDLGQGTSCRSACYQDKIYYNDSVSVLEYDLFTGQTGKIMALEGAVLEDVIDGWVICRNYGEENMVLYNPETGETISKEISLGDNLYGSVTLNGQDYWFMRSVEKNSEGRTEGYQWYLVEPDAYLTEAEPEKITVAKVSSFASGR